MKRTILLLFVWLACYVSAAEMPPIYTETFDRCIDAEDENYGYTGGNDGQWGGNVATAIAIYQDSPEWNFTYCNGAYQCLKVGTSSKQGSATTPAIECEGEAVLTFRVAPWEGDSIFYVEISGGTTTDQKSFNLKKHAWTDVKIHITDIQSSIKVKFTSTSKHRFFLDDVCVRPADPDKGAIRTAEGGRLEWGLMGRNYTASKRVLHVTGANLSEEGIDVSMQDGEPELFQLAANHLPAAGGDLAITCRPGASAGTSHGTFLYLRGKDKATGEKVEKRVMLTFEVVSLNLDGAGTRPNPYSCKDVITLANNEGTIWTGTYYWVTGYVLGGVKRYNDQYDGISQTDKLALVLADDPKESNANRYVLVQINHDARAALNVVDNPELVGVQVKVEGLLLNEKANPMYLGKPGVRNVSTNAQYWRPAKDNLDEEDPMNGANDPDEPVTPITAVEHSSVVPAFNPDQPAYSLLGVQVDAGYHGVVIQNGHTYLR